MAHTKMRSNIVEIVSVGGGRDDDHNVRDWDGRGESNCTGKTHHEQSELCVCVSMLKIVQINETIEFRVDKHTDTETRQRTFRN